MTLSPIPVGLKNQLSRAECSPWRVDATVSPKLKVVPGKNYSTANLSPFHRDSFFIQRYFQQDPPPGFGIKAIHVIHNDDLQGAFESNLSSMEEVASSSSSSSSSHWDSLEPKDARRNAMQRLATMTKEFSPFSHKREAQGQATRFENTRLLPLFHGTSGDIADAISSVGFRQKKEQASASSDDGDDLFGEGIYLTSSAAYASKYSLSRDPTNGSILVTWAAFKDPFPVVSDIDQSHPGNRPSDLKSIQGRPLSGSCDAHYIPVRAVDPSDSSSLVYYPCSATESPRFDQFVIKNSAQTLVRFRIELGVTLPHALPSARIKVGQEEIESSVLHRYPTPEENPLISKQLLDPSQTLSPEESISLLTQCIEYGMVQAQKAAGKDILLIIGNTGAGKSTTVNYLSGCTMESKLPEELGMTGISEVMVVVPPEKGGALAEVMPIGHTKASKTFMPQIETPSGPYKLTYCDCPGFLDNRGSEINIANAVNIRAAIKQAASVKMLILINYFSLIADRGRGLKDVLKICTSLFGKAETLIANKHSLLVGITNTPSKLTLSALKKWIVEDTVPLMKDLLDRLFFFDPMDRPAPESGRWDRNECLTRIKDLKPVAAHGKIFSTVLTDEDENSLVRVSEKIGNTIEKALANKSYAEAAKLLRSLEELSVVEHITLERLIRTQFGRLESHFFKYLHQFKTYCSLDKFTEARSLFVDLQQALFHFPKLTPFFIQEQLPECYNTSYDKYEKAQQKEQTFQKLLADAQLRSERSETMIQGFISQLEEQKEAAIAKNIEQEKVYRLHVQELQEQIEKITLSYESAIKELEQERTERDEKIAKKIEELALANLTEEVAALTSIRSELNAEYDGKLQIAGASYNSQVQEQEDLKAQIELDKKEQEEKFKQDLEKFDAQKAQQEKAMLEAKEQERARFRKIAGEDAERFSKIGGTLLKEGKLTEALEQYQQSLSSYTFLSASSLEVAACHYNIGLINQSLGQHSTSLEQVQKSVEIRERLAPNSLDLSLCYYNMGQVYEVQKEWGKALEQYQKCLEIRKLVSSNRLEVAEMYDNIGHVHRAQGRFEKALENYLEAFKLRAVLTPDGLPLASSYANLGAVYHAMRNSSRAIEQYQKCLSIEEKFRPNTLAIALTYYNIGRELQEQKQVAEALVSYQKSCLIQEQLARNTLDLAATYHNIGLLNHDRGDFQTALDYYKKCLVIEESLKPDSMVVASSYNNIGRVFAAQKKFQEALESYTSSLAIKERLDPNSLNVGTTRHNIGLIYQSQGKRGEALQEFEKSLEIRKSLDPKSLDLATSYHCVGSMHFSLGNDKEALIWILQSLSMYKELAPDSLTLALSHESITKVYCRLKQFSKAEEHLKMCLSLRERLTPDSLLLAGTYFAYGDLYTNLAQEGSSLTYKEKISSALGFYQKGLAIYEKLDTTSANIALCSDRIGNIYHTQGNAAEAKKHYTRSLSLKHSLNGTQQSPGNLLSSPELDLLVDRCKKYFSADRSDKVIAICELQLFLERRIQGLITTAEVLKYIADALSKEKNPIFETSFMRKSDVKILFENVCDSIVKISPQPSQET